MLAASLHGDCVARTEKKCLKVVTLLSTYMIVLQLLRAGLLSATQAPGNKLACSAFPLHTRGGSYRQNKIIESFKTGKPSDFGESPEILLLSLETKASGSDLICIAKLSYYYSINCIYKKEKNEFVMLIHLKRESCDA